MAILVNLVDHRRVIVTHSILDLIAINGVYFMNFWMNDAPVRDPLYRSIHRIPRRTEDAGRLFPTNSLAHVARKMQKNSKCVVFRQTKESSPPLPCNSGNSLGVVHKPERRRNPTVEQTKSVEVSIDRRQNTSCRRHCRWVANHVVVVGQPITLTC